MILLQLFISFFKIGLFSFGGGYAILPMIQQQMVDTYHWMTMSQLADMVAIAEMTPGPIAVNTATFVGTRVAGIPGGIIATLGCVLPSAIIVTLLAIYFFKHKSLGIVQDALAGIRPAVIALISVAAVTLTKNALLEKTDIAFISNFFVLHVNAVALVLLTLVLVLLYRKKIGVITAILGSGIAGAAVFGVYSLLK